MARPCLRLRALLLGSIVSVSASFAAPSVAHADDVVTITPEARARFSAGVNLLKDPDGPRYEEAYREFKAAYASSPSYKILGNLGLCAMKLERDDEAIRRVREVPRAGEGPRILPEIAQVKTDLQTLKAGVVYVSVASDPPGREGRGHARPGARRQDHEHLRARHADGAPRNPSGHPPDDGEARRLPRRDVGVRGGERQDPAPHVHVQEGRAPRARDANDDGTHACRSGARSNVATDADGGLRRRRGHGGAGRRSRGDRHHGARRAQRPSRPTTPGRTRRTPKTRRTRGRR